MKLLIIIALFLLLSIALVFLIIFYIILGQKKNLHTEHKVQKSDTESASDTTLSYLLSEKYKLGWKVYVLMILSVFFIIISFFSPFIFTPGTGDFDFNKTGQIGDTVGGLMNPFIALAGVIITGLAFYVQYKANEMQRDLFKINQQDVKRQLQEQIDHQNHQNKLQQVESQFYEMLKLHRENITEMTISGYDFEEYQGENEADKKPLKKFSKSTDGRKIFVTMQTELEFILKLYSRNRKLDQEGFKRCYAIFFSGLDNYERKYPGDTDFIKHLRLARAQHEFPASSIHKNADRKRYTGDLLLYFNYKPFSGHASRLGHYFRHLYLTVKSIANSEVIEDYGTKMKYLGLLRAQLSNHEQIMLFYNWLSGYGHDWEKNGQQFFTEYKVIHNLTYQNLLDDSFVDKAVNELRNKSVTFRKGKMFELD